MNQSANGQLDTGIHEYLAQDRVVWGVPAAQAVLAECDRRAARRIMIISSKTLNRTTPAIEDIRNQLGPRHVATFDECIEHTPRASVIDAANAARDCNPDLIVTVGGGTAIDTAKVMQIAMAHHLTRAEQLTDFHLGTNPDGSRRVPEIKPAQARQIVVPTTLGAAEFSDFGGCTDVQRGIKDGYLGKTIGAATVILDPVITQYTPPWLWLSTGIRGIDHAVEGICSVQSSPLIQATCLHALRLFSTGLTQSHTNRNDMQARLHCQQAAWLAGLGILRVPYGASHGIGHSLGAVTGISHGYTSCIMLPHVMRYNLPVTRDAQTLIAQALGGNNTPADNAADLVAQLITTLGLPTRLSAQQVDPSMHEAIARGAMENIWVKTNPRPLTEQSQIEALLAAAQ